MRAPRLLVLGLVAAVLLSGSFFALAKPPVDRGGSAGAARAPKPRPPKPDSVGHPNEGRLEGGARLDTSLPYIRVVPAYASGDVRWGLPALVKMIERAARGVAKQHKGSVLDVGDLSRKGGGEVSRHDSHESGRDADLGFYALADKGRQVHDRGFIRFDGTLRATDASKARFDLARNWLLVQLLLTDPGARVSHIFIAEPLRQALLAHARSRGVSRALLDRAAVAMMQPTDSLPHDDHLHVRISCPRSMRGTCIELSKGAPEGRLAGRAGKTPLRGARGKVAGARALRGSGPRAAAPSGSGAVRGRSGSQAPAGDRAQAAAASKHPAQPKKPAAEPEVASAAGRAAGRDATAEPARPALPTPEGDSTGAGGGDFGRDAPRDFGLLKITD